MALAPLPPPAPPGGTPTSNRGLFILIGVMALVVVVIVGLAIASLFILGNSVTPRPAVAISAAPGTDPGVGDTASGGNGQAVGSVQCNSREQFVRHDHAHLFILKDGVAQPVSAYIGIPGAPLAAKCFYWMHTHDRSGIIHMESPSTRPFSLGEFFDVWGQPLSRSQVARIRVPNRRIEVFVDGARYDGDPRGIELKSHTQVVIEIGRHVQPPSYNLNGF